MNSLVSILIPVFNRESIIAETLQSALDQTYKNIEVVIIDNASTDNTWQVIQTFVEQDSRIKAFRNESNLGPVRNWLRCVEEATGEYGKILWSDDLIAPDFIEKTLPLFNDDVGFVYTATKIFTGSVPETGKRFYDLGNTGLYPSETYIKKAIYNKGVPVSPGCAIFRMADIRKNLWLQIPNKVNSDFSMHAIGNDLLLFLLTANEYKYFGHVAEPLSFFRSHEGSISISSKSGKLPLHYALARTYFVENFRPQLKPCFASYVQLLLWRYKDSKVYALESIQDFFQADVKLSKVCLAKKIIIKAIRMPIGFIKKLVG
ncbi:MAG: glycosyltransferase family 2 protein [Campylobacterales bacterium]|nr:glycosyltransferase family 2 protein [Campylobacterales bacterium]